MPAAPDHPPCPSVHRRTHAKLNLLLGVGPPDERPGPTRGYHPIASWFCAIDLADDLTLTLADSPDRVEHSIAWADDAPRPTPIDWPLERDLGVRALRALEARLGVELPVCIRLRKRIPVGAGLGGGSANAAGVLLGVRDLLGLDLATEELRALGASLGADVPFFLDDQHNNDENDTDAPRPAFVTGFGERLERLRRVRTPIVLIVPPFPIATGPVYAAFDAPRADAPRPVPPLRSDLARVIAERGAREGRIPSEKLFNDLAEPAERAEPRLRSLRAELSARLQRPVHVTGSGSAMFVVARDPDDQAADEIRRAFPDLAVRSTRTL